MPNEITQVVAKGFLMVKEVVNHEADLGQWSKEQVERALAHPGTGKVREKQFRLAIEKSIEIGQVQKVVAVEIDA